MSLAAADADLIDAREALAYWETRARSLPHHSLRRRREARELAARWRSRVSEAERAAYGAGVMGAVLLFATERRLPAPVHARVRMMVRRAAQVAAVVCVAVFAMLMTSIVAAYEVVAALVHAVA
jgi:hypothetical protein